VRITIAILLGFLVHVEPGFFSLSFLALFGEDIPLQPFMHDGDLTVIHQGRRKAAPRKLHPFHLRDAFCYILRYLSRQHLVIDAAPHQHRALDTTINPPGPEILQLFLKGIADRRA
jgi:hypothetical protein